MKILQPESPPKVPKKSYAAPTNEADEVSADAIHLDFYLFCFFVFDVKCIGCVIMIFALSHSQDGNHLKEMK